MYKIINKYVMLNFRIIFINLVGFLLLNHFFRILSYAYTEDIDLLLPSEGRFVLNVDIRADQMCVSNEMIWCNAFINSFDFEYKFNGMEVVDSLFGTQLNCPLYPYLNRVIGIPFSKCNIYQNYTAEIDCINITTGKSWVAPAGFFEIKCLEEYEAQLQYRQMYNIQFEYEKYLYELNSLY